MPQGVVDTTTVAEESGPNLFVTVYQLGGRGCLVLEEYQMGFGEVFEEEVPLLYGTVEDIGMSVDNGEDGLLVVEATDAGYWYMMYSVDLEGFWEVLNEFLVEADVVDHLAGVTDDERSVDAE